MPTMNPLALSALVIAYALGPMATQMLTPAVPFVHRDLAIPMAGAQLLISLSFVTIAVATLVYGPLADRYGRRGVMLAGAALFCLGSLVGALAPTPQLLIAGRVIQAAGSAAGIALTRAIVLDVYGAQRSAQVIAYMTSTMILAPMLAPVIGGVLLDHSHWRTLFATCAGVGVVALVLLLRYLPETRRPSDGAPRSGVLADFAALLRDRHYLASAMVFSAVLALFYAGQAALPYLFVEVLRVPATTYGLWFGAACLAFIAGNYAIGRFGARVAQEWMTMVSAVACLLTALAGLIAATLLPWSPAVLFMPTVVLSFFGAVASAQAQARAVALQPQRSGAASGLLSAWQMGLGAAVVQFVGFHHDGTPFTMFGVFIACAGCAVLAAGHGLRASRPAALRGLT